MAIVGLIFFCVMIEAMFAIPLGIVMWCILRLMRNRSHRTRTTASLITASLLFTPVWGPATIAVAPVPFGLLLLLSVATLDWRGLLSVMALTRAWWYLVAFPATALVAYVCRRILLSNNSFKPKPLRGSA
jgi:hypothetical protein